MGPVGGLINAPSSGQARAQTNSRTKALPPWAQEPATHDHTRSADLRPTGRNVVSASSEGEREELDKLRKEMAEVTMERDAAARLVKEAML